MFLRSYSKVSGTLAATPRRIILIFDDFGYWLSNYDKGAD